MRYLEAIGDLLLFAIVLAVFAPLYYTLQLIDKLKER